MTINKGTLITAPIRTPTSNDIFPTAFANEIKGGLKDVALLSDLNSIPLARRSEGMIVYVAEHLNYYKLLPNGGWGLFLSDSGVEYHTHSEEDIVNLDKYSKGEVDGLISNLRTSQEELENKTIDQGNF